jgi:hypothetical protein
MEMGILVHQNVHELLEYIQVAMLPHSMEMGIYLYIECA